MSHSFEENDFKVTANRYGIMHQLNPIAKRFIDFAITCKSPALDIGAAYGVATLPVLLGGGKIIACDISQQHIDAIKEKVAQIANDSGDLLKSNISYLVGRFPEFVMSAESVDAILLSHVLPFLTGKEIEDGIAKASKWLKPNGKMFMLSYSTYNRLMQKYIPTYEQRKMYGDPWPGEIEDASEFWDMNNPLSKVLPTRLNHLDPDILRPILERNGLRVEMNEFLDLKDGIPEEARLSGKETFGSIAKKLPE